ncbi:MAG TPA: transcriptional regulator [Candidatus Thermoplasmatota archaeon]|nr:transcriptional regulator [Candidatus Thermoplasmatota archaeon]
MAPPDPLEFAGRAGGKPRRGDLIEATRQVLARSGFYVSEPTTLRPMAFDIVARRDRELLIVKVLTNVDSLADAVAQEMKVLAQFLEGTPVVVGERSSAAALEDGAMYVRHGIPILTYGTLVEYLVDGVKPLVYAAPGGFYVNINGEALRALREARGLSLGQLAEVAGVSRRAISMYEEGMGAMVEVAMRLEEFLEAPLVEPVDPFGFAREHPEVVVDFFSKRDPPARADPRREAAPEDPAAVLEAEAFQMLSVLGFGVVPLGKSPVNAIATDKDHLFLTGVATIDEAFLRRARAMANLMDVTERHGVFIVERTYQRMTVEGAPLVAREELAKLDEPSDVLELIKERRKRPAP